MRVPRDVWIGLVMLAGAVLYWYGAEGIPISPLDGEVNAAAMPKALAYALGALALLLILRALFIEVMARRAAAASAASAGATGAGPAEEGAARRKGHVRALGMLAIGLAYLLVLDTLGYAVSVALLIFGVAVYMGLRASPRVVAIAVLLAAGFYLIFARLLDIPLPEGILSGILP